MSATWSQEDFMHSMSQLQGRSGLDKYEIALFVLCLFNRSKMDQDHCQDLGIAPYATEHW